MFIFSLHYHRLALSALGVLFIGSELRNRLREEIVVRVQIFLINLRATELILVVGEPGIVVDLCPSKFGCTRIP